MIKHLVVHKTAEAIVEFIANGILDKTVKLKPVPRHSNSRDIEEKGIQPEKRKEILNKLKRIL